MPLEVDYITLGDASERLSTPDNRVPAPTLRHWTDQLEEFNVHYVLRNNRNERIYEESDIKVFAYLRDLKEEYGRRTTTRDLGYMIVEKGKTGELKLRSREEAPPPNPSNRQTDLLNQEDIKRVLESDRARQVIGYLVDEATKNLKNELVSQVREEVREEVRMEMASVNNHIQMSNEELLKLVRSHEELEKTIKEDRKKAEEAEKREEERARQRDEMLVKSMRETMESKKGFFARLFGG